jgi:ankyrin repeat protein
MCVRDPRRFANNRSIATLIALPLGAALSLIGHQALAASAIAEAAEQGSLETVRELIESGTDVNQTEADGSTALLWAAYQAYPEMVSALLEAGADANVTNEFGITPLLQAARIGDAQSVSLLIAAGANPSVFHPSGETPLMAAARSGSVEAVNLLLEAGVDPNAADILENQTALMWAAAEGHADVVSALLDAGADPDIQAREAELSQRTTRTDFPSGGFTALMWAARNGDEAVTRRLIDGGADLSITNADGATAMMIAVVNDRFDFAKTLLDLGADPNDGSLYQAVLMRDATTDWLAKDSTQWRADHPNELTALDLVRVYLEAGADPNKPFIGQLHSTSMCCDTKENATPTFRAAIAADVDALTLLIEHGGDLDWRPVAAEGEGGGGFGPKTIGRTPLMVAMFGGKGVGMAGGPGDIREGRAPPFREEGNRDPAAAVKLLLDAGADPDALSDNDLAAIHLAAEEGKLDIIRLLADAGADLEIQAGNGKTALRIVEGMEPREPPPLTGAMAGRDQGAQPAEVAALLRELMGLDTSTAQASAAGGTAE